MRRHRGQEADVPVIGDHFLDCRGVSFAVDQQLTRRPGMTWLADDGGTLVGSLRTQAAGTFLLVVQTDGNVEALSL